MSDENSFDEGWIQWFLSLEDHQFFCEIDEEFIRNKLNLYGIKQHFTHFQEAMDMVLQKEAPEDEDLENEKFLETYQEAADLYGLLHARFILTPKGPPIFTLSIINKGMQMMREKFLVSRFGVCPRFLCERQQVLPLGVSDDLKISRVKVYCPRCEDIYLPKKRCSDIDGAYFGTSFPHIFLSTFTDLMPKPSTETYIPKIYGFKLFKKNGSDYWNVRGKNKEEIVQKEKERENLSVRFKQFEKKTAVQTKK